MNDSSDCSDWLNEFDSAGMQLLTPAERAEFNRLTVRPLWEPNPGPQTQALACQADELFYGGAAGGGKTSLLCGLALVAHHESIIFRPTFPELGEVRSQLRRLIAGAGEVTQDAARVGSRLVEFGFMQHEDDKEKYRGRPHDFIGIDEAPLFTRSQVQFVTTWLRTTRPGQRCRVVLTGNPPSNVQGEWILDEFAPWLRDTFPDPARPGELRWYVRDPKHPDKLLWSREPHEVKDERSGKMVRALSRTFIPALLTDNPYLGDDYFARVNAQPEPLRSQMLYGDMRIGTTDDPWQVIPTAWVRSAQQRWQQAAGLTPGPVDCLGVDVARGGQCKTVLSPRHGPWFGPLWKFPGTETADGPAVAGKVLAVLGELASTDGDRSLLLVPRIQIDAIGVGSSAYDSLRQTLGVKSNVYPIMSGDRTDLKDRAKVLRFRNVRAFAWWSLREALDPVKGDGLMLPPDPELLADLTAPRWSMTAAGVLIEPKDDITERIGRSPDCGDAVVYAHLQPLKRKAMVW